MVAIGALSFAPSAVSAAAATAEGPFDLYALRSPGLAVTSGSCRYVSFTARSTAGELIESVDAEVDIWNGGDYLSSVSLSSVDGDPTRLTGRYFYCPLEGVGVMRLGPSQVSYYDYDYNSGDFMDSSRGQADIRQGVRSAIGVRRAGSVRTFTARPKYFATGWSDEWTRYPKGTPLRLQRRGPAGTGSWSRVATAKVDGSGKAVFSVRAAKRFQYRVVANGTKNSRPLLGRGIVA